MSQFDRDMNVLNNRRIVYIREPITDIPSEVYDWGSITKKVHLSITHCLKAKLRSILISL